MLAGGNFAAEGSSLERCQPRRIIPARADSPRLYNDQGVRKFDLHGWWQRLNRTWRQPTPNEKLVTYLAAGRNHGYTALRKETRVARNRLILLTLVLIAVLWSILSLLIHSCKRVWPGLMARDSF